MLKENLTLLFDPEGPERCGVIRTTGEVVELTNSHPTPLDAFAMDSAELDSPSTYATWHTHPRTSANLSVEDYAAFRAYPKLSHFIISANTIWCFKTQNGVLIRDEDPFTRLLT